MNTIKKYFTAILLASSFLFIPTTAYAADPPKPHFTITEHFTCLGKTIHPDVTIKDGGQYAEYAGDDSWMICLPYPEISGYGHSLVGSSIGPCKTSELDDLYVELLYAKDVAPSELPPSTSATKSTATQTAKSTATQTAKSTTTQTAKSTAITVSKPVSQPSTSTSKPTSVTKSIAKASAPEKQTSVKVTQSAKTQPTTINKEDSPKRSTNNNSTKSLSTEKKNIAVNKSNALIYVLAGLFVIIVASVVIIVKKRNRHNVKK